ncbi:thioredoxin [Romboutsia maritimum]|uniref:Thioredoxin n=1 Tax=Romboutsia maritimum TaxID=2020948 RepID=A0A371ITG3_9FIRM|nr:thioredoxin [Romboutsia maritimum]RDY23761.1 thioredoxin [Romboutsia maritimum]
MANIINTSQFRSDVENSSGVVVVDFFATWCGPCKMLAPVFEELGEEMEEEAKFVKIDIDQSLEIAQKFRVSTVPTMMIFKDGKPVDTMIGFMPKEKIKDKVQSHL